MMNRLTGLDGISLHGETTVMPTHVLGVVFFDPAARGELTARALWRQLSERADPLPAFRQRLLTRPFGLGQPAWIEDPAFDIREHLHHLRLPEPGTIEQLSALIADLHARPLDRNRPLWDAWVVQGLADGRLVVIIKFSHAMADGVGAVTTLLPQLMTTGPEPEAAAVTQRTRATAPGVAARVWDVVDEAASNTVVGLRVTSRLAPLAVKSLAGTAVRQLIGNAGRRHADAPAPEPRESSPRTLLNAPLTARRSVAFAQVPMDEMRDISSAFGVTVNDVFLTATTSALRRWLETYDAVPNSPLHTMMPISTRTADDNTSNSWSPVAVALPVQIPGAAEQLASIHAATSRIKKGRRSTPPVNLADVITLVPPTVIGLASGLYSNLKLSRFHSPVAHAITSNVPGPRDAMYCAGAQAMGIHAMAPLVEGANLNVTAVSYDGTFGVGIVACPDNVEDVASLALGIEEVVSELKCAADEKTGHGTEVIAESQFAHANSRGGAQAATPGTKQSA